ncbi:MAG: PAS domain S-box protein [Deltaproteobacteria bacterium]|nr:PAS domain S-box protein [Deltaproteobacteria bacterium]
MSESERWSGEGEMGGLLDAAPDAMVVVDAQGRLMLVNQQAEKLFGWSREELIGQSIEVLVPTRYRAAHPLYRNGYASSPHPRPMGAGLDLHALRRDGREFPAEISLSPLETRHGRLTTAAIRDVSERRRLEELRRRTLEDASRLKSEFLANMSHELRTPLNSIIGFASLMEAGRVGTPSAQQKELLGDILNSSKHLLQLINDVLDLAKIEAGRVQLNPEPLDLSLVVREVKDTLRGMAAEKRVSLESVLDPGCLELNLDRGKLKQVLFNYLSNALKFTPEGGRIVVRALAEGAENIRLEVEDNGIGIAPEDLKTLFTEFRQLDSSAAKKYQGTGLGLALTKKIVEAQGGRVEAISEPGQGSTFVAVLPRRSPPSPGE